LSSPYWLFVAGILAQGAERRDPPDIFTASPPVSFPVPVSRVRIGGLDTKRLIYCVMPSLIRLAILGMCLGAAPAVQAQDAIIGTWVGEATQGETKFETRLTFVSTTGGVSRYPSFVCGGILAGDRRDDAYEFNETVTWGGMDEKPDGCIHGVVRLTVDGDKMKYEWSGTHNGENYSAAGELHRVKRRR
jgi:hypothetical protein